MPLCWHPKAARIASSCRSSPASARSSDIFSASNRTPAVIWVVKPPMRAIVVFLRRKQTEGTWIQRTNLLATIAPYWLIAAAVLSLIALGICDGKDRILASVRFAQVDRPHRLCRDHRPSGMAPKNRLPQPVRPFSRFEHLGRFAPDALACTVALLTGMLYSGASGHGIRHFWLALYFLGTGLC